MQVINLNLLFHVSADT